MKWNNTWKRYFYREAQNPDNQFCYKTDGIVAMNPITTTVILLTARKGCFLLYYHLKLDSHKRLFRHPQLFVDDHTPSEVIQQQVANFGSWFKTNIVRRTMPSEQSSKLYST